MISLKRIFWIFLLVGTQLNAYSSSLVFQQNNYIGLYNMKDDSLSILVKNINGILKGYTIKGNVLY